MPHKLDHISHDAYTTVYKVILISWTDECIGEKLTVTKHHRLCVYAIQTFIYIYIYIYIYMILQS